MNFGDMAYLFLPYLDRIFIYLLILNSDAISQVILEFRVSGPWTMPTLPGRKWGIRAWNCDGVDLPTSTNLNFGSFPINNSGHTGCPYISAD